jgi:hypothetical protein
MIFRMAKLFWHFIAQFWHLAMKHCDCEGSKNSVLDFKNRK